MCQRGFHHSSYYSSGETCTECNAVNETLRAELAAVEERSDSAAGWEGYATAVEERQRARFAEMTGGHPDDMPF